MKGSIEGGQGGCKNEVFRRQTAEGMLCTVVVSVKENCRGGTEVPVKIICDTQENILFGKALM